MSNAAIVDGVLQHVSASQLATYARCARRWVADKKLGVREPETEALAAGKSVHAEMEAYYLDGVIPTHPSARIMVERPEIPVRRAEHVLVEWPTSYQLGIEAAGVPLKGRMDLFLRKTSAYAQVWDWKTAKAFRYAKSAVDLETNIQGAIYMKAAFENFPELEEVTFHHGYIRTDPKLSPAVKVVSTRPLKRPHVDAQFAIVEATVEQMQDVIAQDDIELVPGNPAACHDYRKPCPFAEQCTVYQAHHRSLIPPTNEEDAMSLMEKLAIKRALAAAEAGINPPDAALPDPTPLAEASDARLTAMERRQDALAERMTEFERRAVNG